MLPLTDGVKGMWVPEGIEHGTDSDTGLKVTQLTNQVAMATNIYGEDPYCSAVSNRAVFIRSYYSRSRGPVELWVYDFNTSLSMLVEPDLSNWDIANHAYGDGFFYFRYSTGRREMIRLDLSTLEQKVVHVLPESHPRFARWGAVSPDHRYYCNVVQGDAGIFHVRVIDLQTGEETTVASGTDLCNAHVGFDRMDGRYIFVQQNRGQRLAANGRIETTDPTAGATLFVVSRDGRERIELPIARPLFNGAITGHEAWIRGEPEILYSADLPRNYAHADSRRGNLFVYRLGEPQPRLVADDPFYNGHVSTSECGRYWVNDRFDPTGIWIAIGSIRSGKWRNLCRMGGPMLKDEIGHAHPYLTPDKKRVLFVSVRTQTPQVFAVHIPAGFLEELA